LIDELPPVAFSARALLRMLFDRGCLVPMQSLYRILSDFEARGLLERAQEDQVLR